jgi:uncharacterized protein
MRTTTISTRIRVALWCAVLLACLTVPAARGTEIPYLAGRVNDNAELLSADTRRDLETTLTQHEDSTSNQIVVLTVSSLESESIEEFSIRVVDTWKLGQKGKDNGILLLVAKDDRQVRIEVGRGLEGDLTDALCAQIIRREIVPNFKGGDYDRGVRAGVEAIIGAIAGSYTADDTDTEGFGDFGANLFAFLFFLFVVGIFTVIALITPGCAGWFLYAFLLPFWGLFPYATLGTPVGPALGLLYALGFPFLKLLLPKSTWGKGVMKSIGKGLASGRTGPGGWSSGRGGSSGGGFSGGGGSFSGGGSSGSW